MVLHPSGGSIEYIQKIAAIIIISHSIAIVAIPLTVLGFWGLHKKLEDDTLLSLLAFITACIAMLAVTCAAAINGLALPLFANRFKGESPEVIESIRPIFKYGLALNNAFDFIFIGFLCIAILLWSVVTIRTKKLPAVLGWSGVVIVAAVVVIVASGFTLVSLNGFRIFLGALVAWLLAAAISLRQSEPKL